MRLVLVVPRFPRPSETFIVNKFTGLADAGWDVHIVCGRFAADEWDKFPALAARPELRQRVHRQWPHQPRPVAALLWLPAFLAVILRAPRAAGRYLRAGGWSPKRFYLDAALIALSPDIIHFEFGALAVGRTHLKKSLNCCLSASFRGYDLAYAGIDDPDYYQELWATADGLHVLSHSLWRRAVERGCPPDMPHALIPPAVDMERFSVGDGERDYRPIGPERPLRILSVGRLEWVKGYEYALQAVGLLAERGVPFEYRIIGDGDYLEPLAFARHQLGLESVVHFLGARTQPEVADEMRQADVLLHAAVSEGFCNAVLEGQAMGLPIVCSDAAGLPENVADGRTGLIAPRRDPAALAERLALLAEDSELRYRLGAAGRARVTDCFRLPEQIAAFDRFYREMGYRHAG